MAESLEQTGQVGASCTSTDGTTRLDHNTPISKAGFFDLPLELRLEIYKHAFHKGFLYVHDRQPFWGAFPHISKCVVHPFCDTQRTRKGNDFFRDCRRRRGLDCPEKLPIESLQACRAFYAEASEILWSTNTWHFESVDVLRDVLSRIGPCNQAAIKRLSLAIPWWNLLGSNSGEWIELLRGPLVETLPGLRELKVAITHLKGSEKRFAIGYRRQVRLFGTFSKIPLQKVEVSLHSLYPGKTVQRPCMEIVRLWFAQRIKRQILGEASEHAVKYLPGQRRSERERLDRQRRRIGRRTRREESCQRLEAELNVWIEQYVKDSRAEDNKQTRRPEDAIEIFWVDQKSISSCLQPPR